jgi:Ca-activated chloride channel family protein
VKLSYRLSHSSIPASADAEALLLVTISAPLGKIERRPVNLGVALDRSGSMSGEPLAIAKAALEQFVDQLLPEDRLTIVAFDDLATPVVTGQKASDKAAIRMAIAGIDVGGMTNLSAGWLSTSDIVASAADPGTYSRIAVLSDGHANAGITDHDKLADIAVGLRTRGIATTAVGVGANYDDSMLSLLAAQSGGNLHHLDTLDGVGQILASEFEELIGLYAQNLVLEIAPDANVLEATVLSGYPVQSRAHGLSIACGDIVSGDDRHVLIRFRCAPRTDGTHPLTGVSLKYHQVAGDVAFKELTALVAIDRATGLDATPVDTIVAQHLVIAKSVIARRNAAEHAECGDIASAGSILSNAATQAREVGLEGDAMELDRARIALDYDHVLASKMMRNHASAQSRTRRRRPNA